MPKAIFLDFYGTVAYEVGPIAVEVVKRVYKQSNAKSMEDILDYWWKTFREKLANANGEQFKTQHEVALENFRELAEYFETPENPEGLLSRMEEHWCTTPVYEDARAFLEKVELPVYFVTNSDDSYVQSAVLNHNLHPAGIITSEQAKYSKPREEIFLYALKKTGLKPQDVIHIGDSLESDVRCPGRAGIKGIWLNRESKTVPKGVSSIGNLMELSF